MTTTEVINEIDSVKPNQFSEEQKRKWVSRIEAKIIMDIVNTHVGGEDKKPSEIISTTSENLLTAAYPYDALYVWYLQAQIDQANGEIGKYNNSMTLFNQSYQEFADFYNRTNEPISKASTIKVI